MTKRTSLAAMLLLLVSLLASPATTATAQVETGDLLITNATVLTVTNGTLENTDILVRDGQIAQIGQGLQAPSGVQTIDATGQFVMPGIIDAHSHIAINGINEGTSPVTSEVGVGDALNPYHIGLYRALAGGVTTSHLMHGSANVIGGQCETVKHRYGMTDPDALRLDGAPRTIKFALGENPTRSHGRRSLQGAEGKVPFSRMGVEFVIREAFSEGERYRDAWDQYEAQRASNPRAIPPEYNERLDVMADILRGDIIVQAHSYRADEILMLMNVMRDFGVDKLTFQHVNEGFKVAPELADFGAGASIFLDNWAYKWEVYYSTAYSAAILTRNGVVTSVNSDSGERTRRLFHEAAKSQKYGGLSDDEALALITINPAKQLGIDDRVGSIEVGKDADLVLFNAHPLSIYAIPQKTVLDGLVRFDREADPDDMRLFVDPEAPVEAAMIWEEHDHSQCMEGVTDFYDFISGQ